MQEVRARARHRASAALEKLTFSTRRYDPRLRPWYSEAFSKAKNLVVVLDGSGGSSESEFLALKAGAQAVLGTLAAGDTASVIIVRGNDVEEPGDDVSDLTYKACHGEQMLRMGVINKGLLQRFVEEAEWRSDGNADLHAAVDRAQVLLTAQRALKAEKYPSIASEDVVVVLASSEDGAADASQYTELKAQLDPPAHWFLHALEGSGLDVSASTFGAAASRASQVAGADMGFEPARYYTLPALATNTESFASAFYMDTSGLGLVTTIVTPVVADGVTKGVIGMDVSDWAYCNSSSHRC